MVLEALSVLLERDGDIEVVAQVRHGRAALQAVSDHEADVLLTDIEMPVMTGLDVLQALGVGSRIKVVVVTTFARPGYLQRAMDAGASGYLLKDSPARELADAIRRVHRGERVINPQLAAEALAERDPLTDRERQVLRLAGEGASSEEIATQLGVSNGTVRNHLSEVIGKLGVTNRIEAARIARSKGWL